MRTILLILIIFQSLLSYSQDERKFIRDGNSKYNGTKYSEAEISYRKALEKDPNSFKAAFNLGDALYKQKKYEEAASQFQSIANTDITKEEKAKVYHNLGNSYMQTKKYKESIEAYKQALRNNPTDVETKYNLAYANKMMQQQQKQQQNDKNDKNKDKNQDKKPEQKQGEKDQNISKEDAERLLKSIENDEKKLQQDMKKAVVKTQKTKIEKDW